MAVNEKTKLLNEITARIQALNLLASTLKADRSRKPDTIEAYRNQFYEMLSADVKGSKTKK